MLSIFWNERSLCDDVRHQHIPYRLFQVSRKATCKQRQIDSTRGLVDGLNEKVRSARRSLLSMSDYSQACDRAG